ncbi:MAG: acireductone synthase [Rhodanobacteraceae bacterium]
MISTILTDIEGTTSSLDFVRDTLFPYARKRLPAFITTHAERSDVEHWLQQAAREAGLISATRQELIDLLIGWIDVDRKSTALKALQGMIWEEGYRSGEFRAHFYADAVRCLRAWHAQGKRICVYSSGSVPAQKLFFEYADSGDLSDLVAAYFDTETGPKRETQSYRRIAEAIRTPPTEILFLSDIVEELDAASAAGFATTLVARAPSRCPEKSTHSCVGNFDAIVP